ncbi:MAG: AraC family transcriptional regulator [Candidatus Eisenbacteria bacterium]
MTTRPNPAACPPLDARLGVDPVSVRRRLVPTGVVIDPVRGGVEAPLYLTPQVCAGLTILEGWSPLWSVATQTNWMLLGFSHTTYFVELESGWRVVSPGDVIFVNPGTIRSMETPARSLMRGDYLWFPEETIVAAMAEIDPSVREREARPFHEYNAPLDLRTFLLERRLFRYLLESPAPDPLFVEEMAHEVLGGCLRLLCTGTDRATRTATRSATRSARDLAVETAKQFVADNLTRSFHSTEVGHAVNVSPTHLREIFRRRTGVSLHRYVTDLRLKAAFDRLGDYRGSYTQLGLDLGFCSGQHFCNTFRQRFGASPRRLLERCRRDGRGSFADWVLSEPEPMQRAWPFVIVDRTSETK